MSERNSWEALCELASRERWCWKLSCTTCGATPFRRAIREIGEGKHPDQVGWPTQNELLQRGPLPVPARNPIAIAEQLVHADLSSVAETCRFPDWLGHIGLALYELQA